MKIFQQQYFKGVTAIIVCLAAVKILFHLLLPEYGYFRDELYYISIGDQFHISNWDMLPLSPLYLKFFTLVFGYSLKSVHLASSILGAASLVLTCTITKELGGGKYAVFLSGVFILFSGFTIFGSLFTYDSMEFLVVVSVLFLLVRIIQANNQKLWITVGLLLGLGLLNKFTILFFGLAIFVSLWLVPQRIMFRSKFVWLGGIIALLFLIPSILWQSRHDWYFLEFASSYAGGLSYLASFPEFVWNQILPNNIFSLPVWLTGLYLLLFSTEWKQYKFFGIMYIVLFLIFFTVGAKFYFLIPMYAILLSVGSMKLEKRFSRSKKIKIAIPVFYVLSSVPFLPMQVPLLPVNSFIQFAGILGVDAGVKYENNALNQLPQHFADRFGWEELVKEISEEYAAIPQDSNTKAGILTNNWGVASAVHFYREKYRLPEPVSNAGWYYFENYRKAAEQNTFIAVGFPEGTLRFLFSSVTKKRTFTNPYCMPHENNRPIFLCREPRVDIIQYFTVEKNIDPEFLSILRSKGGAKAIEFFQKQKTLNDKIVLFTESQINALGYEFLGKKSIDEAILLLKFNVELFPESFNVYDSLGEAYLIVKNYELSVLNYKKSVELNPNNTNGKEKLVELSNILNQQ